MTSVNEQRTPYEIMGEDGIRRLVNAFYDVMESSPDAEDIRAMHAADLTPMRRMLTAYLTTWMGGPPVYIALKGSMCLTDAHAAFHIGPAARDQWLACMEKALDTIDADESLKALLAVPFQRVAEAVQNRPSNRAGSADEVVLIAKG